MGSGAFTAFAADKIMPASTSAVESNFLVTFSLSFPAVVRAAPIPMLSSALPVAPMPVGRRSPPEL